MSSQCTKDIISRSPHLLKLNDDEAVTTSSKRSIHRCLSLLAESYLEGGDSESALGCLIESYKWWAEDMEVEECFRTYFDVGLSSLQIFENGKNKEWNHIALLFARRNLEMALSIREDVILLQKLLKVLVHLGDWLACQRVALQLQKISPGSNDKLDWLVLSLWNEWQACEVGVRTALSVGEVHEKKRKGHFISKSYDYDRKFKRVQIHRTKSIAEEAFAIEQKNVRKGNGAQQIEFPSNAQKSYILNIVINTFNEMRERYNDLKELALSPIEVTIAAASTPEQLTKGSSTVHQAVQNAAKMKKKQVASFSMYWFMRRMKERGRRVRGLKSQYAFVPRKLWKTFNALMCRSKSGEANFDKFLSGGDVGFTNGDKAYQDASLEMALLSIADNIARLNENESKQKPIYSAVESDVTTSSEPQPMMEFEVLLNMNGSPTSVFQLSLDLIESFLHFYSDDTPWESPYSISIQLLLATICKLAISMHTSIAPSYSSFGHPKWEVYSNPSFVSSLPLSFHPKPSSPSYHNIDEIEAIQTCDKAYTSLMEKYHPIIADIFLVAYHRSVASTASSTSMSCLSVHRLNSSEEAEYLQLAVHCCSIARYQTNVSIQKLIHQMWVSGKVTMALSNYRVSQERLMQQITAYLLFKKCERKLTDSNGVVADIRRLSSESKICWETIKQNPFTTSEILKRIDGAHEVDATTSDTPIGDSMIDKSAVMSFDVVNRKALTTIAMELDGILTALLNSENPFSPTPAIVIESLPATLKNIVELFKSPFIEEGSFLYSVDNGHETAPPSVTSIFDPLNSLIQFQWFSDGNKEFKGLPSASNRNSQPTSVVQLSPKISTLLNSYFTVITLIIEKWCVRSSSLFDPTREVHTFEERYGMSSECMSLILTSTAILLSSMQSMRILLKFNASPSDDSTGLQEAMLRSVKSSSSYAGIVKEKSLNVGFNVRGIELPLEDVDVEDTKEGVGCMNNISIHLLPIASRLSVALSGWICMELENILMKNAAIASTNVMVDVKEGLKRENNCEEEMIGCGMQLMGYLLGSQLSTYIQHKEGGEVEIGLHPLCCLMSGVDDRIDEWELNEEEGEEESSNNKRMCTAATTYVQHEEDYCDFLENCLVVDQMMKWSTIEVKETLKKFSISSSLSKVNRNTSALNGRGEQTTKGGKGEGWVIPSWLDMSYITEEKLMEHMKQRNAMAGCELAIPAGICVLSAPLFVLNMAMRGLMCCAVECFDEEVFSLAYGVSQSSINEPSNQNNALPHPILNTLPTVAYLRHIIRLTYPNFTDNCWMASLIPTEEVDIQSRIAELCGDCIAQLYGIPIFARVQRFYDTSINRGGVKPMGIDRKQLLPLSLPVLMLSVYLHRQLQGLEDTPVGSLKRLVVEDEAFVDVLSLIANKERDQKEHRDFYKSISDGMMQCLYPDAVRMSFGFVTKNGFTFPRFLTIFQRSHLEGEEVLALEVSRSPSLVEICHSTELSTGSSLHFKTISNAQLLHYPEAVEEVLQKLRSLYETLRQKSVHEIQSMTTQKWELMEAVINTLNTQIIFACPPSLICFVYFMSTGGKIALQNNYWPLHEFEALQRIQSINRCIHLEPFNLSVWVDLALCFVQLFLLSIDRSVSLQKWRYEHVEELSKPMQSITNNPSVSGQLIKELYLHAQLLLDLNMHIYLRLLEVYRRTADKSEGEYVGSTKAFIRLSGSDWQDEDTLMKHYVDCALYKAVVQYSHWKHLTLNGSWWTSEFGTNGGHPFDSVGLSVDFLECMKYHVDCWLPNKNTLVLDDEVDTLDSAFSIFFRYQKSYSRTSNLGLILYTLKELHSRIFDGEGEVTHRCGEAEASRFMKWQDWEADLWVTSLLSGKCMMQLVYHCYASMTRTSTISTTDECGVVAVCEHPIEYGVLKEDEVMASKIRQEDGEGASSIEQYGEYEATIRYWLAALCDFSDAVVLACKGTRSGIELCSDDNSIREEEVTESKEWNSNEIDKQKLSYTFVSSRTSIHLFRHISKYLDTAVREKSQLPFAVAASLYKLHSYRLKLCLYSQRNEWKIASIFPWKPLDTPHSDTDVTTVIKRVNEKEPMGTVRIDALLAQLPQRRDRLELLMDAKEAIEYLSNCDMLGNWITRPAFALAKCNFLVGNDEEAIRCLKAIMSKSGPSLWYPDTPLDDHYSLQTKCRLNVERFKGKYCMLAVNLLRESRRVVLRRVQRAKEEQLESFNSSLMHMTAAESMSIEKEGNKSVVEESTESSSMVENRGSGGGWMFGGLNRSFELDNLFEALQLCFEGFQYVTKEAKHFGDLQSLDFTKACGINLSIQEYILKQFSLTLVETFYQLSEACPDVLSLQEMRNAIFKIFGEEMPPLPVRNMYVRETASLDLRIVKLMKDLLAYKSLLQPVRLIEKLEDAFVKACERLLYCEPDESDFESSTLMKLSLGIPVWCSYHIKGISNFQEALAAYNKATTRTKATKSNIAIKSKPPQKVDAADCPVIEQRRQRRMRRAINSGTEFFEAEEQSVKRSTGTEEVVESMSD